MFNRTQLERLRDESGDPDNPDPDALRDIVRGIETIAVVGLSRDPAKPARRVPSYLATKGATIYPVNPFADRILGKPARDSLSEVTEPVDAVLVFRPSEEAAEIVREAAARDDEPVIWLQEGIRAAAAAADARAAGRTVVQSLCMYKVHRALGDTFMKVGQSPTGR